MPNISFKQLDMVWYCFQINQCQLYFCSFFSKQSEHKSKYNRRQIFYNKQTTLFSILLVVRSDQRQRASNPDPFESRFNALKLPLSHSTSPSLVKKEAKLQSLLFINKPHITNSFFRLPDRKTRTRFFVFY